MFDRNILKKQWQTFCLPIGCGYIAFLLISTIQLYYLYIIHIIRSVNFAVIF